MAESSLALEAPAPSERQICATPAKIDRLVAALAAGADDVPRAAAEISSNADEFVTRSRKGSSRFRS